MQMSTTDYIQKNDSQVDQLLNDLADYVLDYTVESEEAYRIAQHVLLDSLGTAILSLRFPECAKHLVLLYRVPICRAGPGFRERDTSLSPFMRHLISAA